MLYDDDFVSCKECGYRQFEAQQTFMIKKIYADTPRREVSYVRIPSERIICSKCGSELNLED